MRVLREFVSASLWALVATASPAAVTWQVDSAGSSLQLQLDVLGNTAGGAISVAGTASGDLSAVGPDATLSIAGASLAFGPTSFPIIGGLATFSTPGFGATWVGAPVAGVPTGAGSWTVDLAGSTVTLNSGSMQAIDSSGQQIAAQDFGVFPVAVVLPTTLATLVTSAPGETSLVVPVALEKTLPPILTIFGFVNPTLRVVGTLRLVLTTPPCSDGIDNDGDYLVDSPEDLGCDSPADGSERGAPICDDGVDNDGDGPADFPADLGCQSSTDTDELGPVVVPDVIWTVDTAGSSVLLHFDVGLGAPEPPSLSGEGPVLVSGTVVGDVTNPAGPSPTVEIAGASLGFGDTSILLGPGAVEITLSSAGGTWVGGQSLRPAASDGPWALSLPGSTLTLNTGTVRALAADFGLDRTVDFAAAPLALTISPASATLTALPSGQLELVVPVAGSATFNPIPVPLFGNAYPRATISGSVRLVATVIVDSDGDGLSDTEEAARGTDPLDADTDDDGLTDGAEVNLYGTNPLSSDSDADGLSDSQELGLGTSPTDSDSDDDGLTDGAEVNLYGTNPLSLDSDADGLSDAQEVALGTDPTDPDSNDNGIPDGQDVEFVQDDISALPNGAFKSPPAALRRSMVGILEDIEAEIASGDSVGAIAGLTDLRRHVDGCGVRPDRNDWIVECVAQRQVRALVDELIANLGG